MLHAFRRRQTSFGQKYDFSFYFVLVILIISEIVNLFLTIFVIGTYNANYDGLEVLNEVYQYVEIVKEDVDHYDTFLITEYYEHYTAEKQDLLTAQENLWNTVSRRYSRETVDFYYTVNTYIQEADYFANVLLDTQGETDSAEALARQNQARMDFQDKFQNTVSAYNTACTQQMGELKKSRDQVGRAWKEVLGFQVFILLLGAGISVSYHSRVKKQLLESLQQLTDFAEMITNTGQYPEEPLRLDTGDEISLLADAFNEMLNANQAQLKQIQENIRIKERLQKTEMENMRISNDLKTSRYKLLESRINPHFLFNTLNMILQTAYIEQAENTSRLIGATADFLRYNLSHLSKIGTIGDEIRNVKNYTYIQEQRYGARIRFIYELDETLYGRHMPCMILQPLVENAVTHGIKSMLRDAVVMIRLYRSGDKTYLEVENNGPGIDGKTLERLREQMNNEELPNEHIGLQNVNMRLHLYFGDSVAFDVDSQPGKTVCRISMWAEEE